MNWACQPGPTPAYSRWPGPSPILKARSILTPSISQKPFNTAVWTAIAAYNMFLPTNIDEAKVLGWDKLDIILITGDTYIDSPFIGAAVIGKVLVNAGFRVGIIAQPNIKSDNDITRLG